MTSGWPNPMDATDWITAVVAVLASGLSVAAFVYSRRATVAAESSAKSSKESADAAQRSAAVSERQEQRELQEAEDRAVRWSVERLGNAVVKVCNYGERTAYGVTIEPSPGIGITGIPPVVDAVIPDGTGVRVGASEHDFDHDSSWLDLAWRKSPDGPAEMLRYPL